MKAIQNVFWHRGTSSVSCELGRSFVTSPETCCSSVHVFKLRGKRVMYKAPFCAFPRGRSEVEIRGVCCRYYHNSWRPLSRCIGKSGLESVPQRAHVCRTVQFLLGQRRSFLQCGGGVCVSACLTLGIEWVLHDRAQFNMDLGQPCYLWMERGNQAVNTKQSVKIKVNMQKHKWFLFSIF